MIILDTNVISAMMLRRPDPVVLNWVDGKHSRAFATTSVSVFEITSGIERLPAGPRLAFLEMSFRTALRDVMSNRIIPLDTIAAETAGRVTGMLFAMNRTIGVSDSLIAGITLSAGAALATRNTRHFEGLGIPLFNPWSSAP